jgi:phosphonopyruvate decarboxylase
MGSCLTSLNNPYDIYFPIIVSWRKYQKNDSEIQHKHLSDELPALIKAYGYDYEILDKENIKIAIEQINNCNNRKNICILEKDTFSKEELNNNNKLILSRYLPRSKYLKTLNKLFSRGDALLIGTTGNTAREMYNYMPDTNNFYMVGNMGGALSLGLGAALGGKKVIVCGGDAEFVMHMGGLTTAGRYKGNINLTYILFDNESNKSTGGQKTYQNHLNYSNIAKNSGFTICDEIINDVNDFEKVLSGFTKKGGLNFVWVKCAYDEEVPRPPIENIKINNFVRRGND